MIGNIVKDKESNNLVINNYNISNVLILTKIQFINMYF